MQTVININHYHAPKEKTPTKPRGDHKSHEYALLMESTSEPSPKLSPLHSSAAFDDHDYDEPYFEPACKEEELLLQLKSLGVPIIAEDSLE
jgi:hypothetical protein